MAATTQTLLLENGEMLTGLLEADAESFHVRTADGGRMVVPRRKVVLVARDEQAAHTHLSRRVSDHDVTALVRLIEWCLEHRLLDAADGECHRLSRVAPRHPELPSLTARLRFLTAGPDESPRTAPLPSPRRIVDEAAGPDIPAAAVADFTRRIQPLLMNSCATATCHGRAAENAFVLSQPLRGLHFTKRLTDRNLQSVLRQISFVTAEASPLLRMAESAHADLTAAPLPDQAAEQRDSLRAWIGAVTGQSCDVADGTPPALAANGRPAPTANSAVQFASHTAPAEEPPTESPASPAARVPVAVERDPFDPAPFNRP